MVVYILFLSALLFFYGLESQSLTQFIEYYYVESAREMIELNDWLVPHFNYEYRFDKPILFYWLIAFSYKLFGVSWSSARLVSSLSAAGVAFITWKIGKKKWGNRGGVLAVLILISTPHFMLQSRDAMTDMTLTFFLTLSIYAFAQIAVRNENNSGNKNLWFSLLYSSLALVTLTKGPIGFIIAICPMLAYKIKWWKKTDLRDLKIGRGIILYLLITLPWIVTVIKTYGLKIFLRIIHVGDAAGDDPIKEPFYYYFEHLFMEFFPWGPLLILFIMAMLLKDRQLIKEHFNKESFFYFWLLIPILVLSCFSKKIARYILPVAPAVALLLTGLFLTYIDEKKKYLEKIVKVFSCFLSFAFLLAGTILTVGIILIAGLYKGKGFGFIVPPIVLIAGGLALIRLLKNENYLIIPAVVSGVIVVSFVFAGTHTLEGIDSRPFIPFGKVISNSAHKYGEALVYKQDPNKLVFYAKTKVKSIYTQEELKKITEGKKDVFCVIRDVDFKNFEENFQKKFEIVKEGYEWGLVDTFDRFKRFVNNPDEFKEPVFLIKKI